MNVKVLHGKYEYVFDYNTGLSHWNRYGEYWKDCTGDNLIFYMANEIADLRDELKMLKEKCGEQ